MKKTILSKDDPTIPPSSKATQPSSNLYSSIVGSLQSQGTNDTRNAKGDNPFKYSKEEVLQVYSSLDHDKMQAPLDFERHDEVTSSSSVQPISLSAPSDTEQRLLAGNINSDTKQRRTEQFESRASTRKDPKNGHRDSRKLDGKKMEASNSNGRSKDHLGATSTVESRASAANEAARDAFSKPSARNTSRLATMGVFDTSVGPESSRWKDDKDDDVLKEAMRHDDGHDEVERLTDMYSNQSLASALPAHHSQPQRGYGEQSFYPMSNGMPDVLGKPSMYGPQQSVHRGPFLGNTPSPALQTRSEQQPSVTTRIMVMPDKLKWQYRDPTGQNQGPFSGLEMHDWYKAGFFQPNLLVKREEDEEFEPLSILVRRIGNQREPFLVPLPSRVSTVIQSKTSGQDGSDWSGAQNWSASGSVSSAAQPPFPQSFPSFGTTLTAEQQNALERRKQEEQYLMHRQREFLQQQQYAHSMSAQRPHHSAGTWAGNEQTYPYAMDRSMDRRQSPFPAANNRHGSTPSLDNAMQNQQGHTGWSGYAPQSHHAARGQQQDFGAGIFDNPKSEVTDQKLRDPISHNMLASSEISMHSRQPSSFQERSTEKLEADSPSQQVNDRVEQPRHELATITEPKSKAKQRRLEPGRDEQAMPSATDPLGKTREATSTTIKDAIEVSKPTESTESASTTAPWALSSTSRSKSFRDIQEVESRKAAKLEAERRAIAKLAAEKVLLEAERSSAIENAGQSSINLQWAEIPEMNGNNSTANGFAAWKAASASNRKTLAQIQQEEESARKTRALQNAKVNALDSNLLKTASVTGTRYADTASKSNSSWSTVGASGKIGSPTTVKHNSNGKLVGEPIVQQSKNIGAGSDVSHGSRSVDPMFISTDFYQWAQSALKGLNPGVNFSEFLTLLLSFGTDGSTDTREIISDSIYANSATLDGRRFADEFCRRRKEDLKNRSGENKSIAEHSSNESAPHTSNGWNDVVKSKRVEAEEDQWNANFKVQVSKNQRRKK